MKDRPKPPSIRKRTNPSGKKIWVVDYIDPETGNRKRENVGTRKEDADRHANQLYDQMMIKWRGEVLSSKKTRLWMNYLRRSFGIVSIH
ncbi:MAG TPA: hypothetical protein ENH10_09135 [Bacteroidetes bacterium]|nr:hypothetical protein [Bacteroidota bacterium]HEX05298.1 hypothetical protein [Bacteroidota bacterium]